VDAVNRIFLTAVLTAGVWAGAASPASAAGSTLSPAGQEGLEQVATCLKSNPNLVALLVVDESGSLQGTDPEARRAPVLADFVEQLAALSGQQTDEGPRTVELAVTTFANGTRPPLIPWTPLTTDNAPSIADTLRTDLPSKNQGDATDYEDAVSSARGLLAQGVAALAAPVSPCKLVVWFTDGVLEISEIAAENAASADRLCAIDGPIDKLRRDGANLISVLLLDRDRLNGLSDGDRRTFEEGIALLQSTAEGVGQAGKYESICGTVPIPGTYAKGAFFEGNLDALAGQFAQAVAIGSGGTGGDISPGSPATFTIEPGFTEFWVTAQAPEGFTLSAPDGSSIKVGPLEPGGQVAGSDADVTWTLDTFTAKILVNPAGHGIWTLTRGGTESDASVYLFSNLDLRIDPVDLVADEPTTIAGQVVGPDGSAADLSAFSDKILNVTQFVDGQEVDSKFDFGPGPDQFSGTFTPETDSSEVRFDLTLRLTTASGFELAPLTKSFVQQVKLPGGYPQPTVQALDLGSLQDQGATAEQSLVFTGSPDGETKVCVDGADILSALDGAGVSISASPNGECITIAPSGEATVQVAATLGQAVADGGVVDGEVRFRLTNARTPELRDTKERDLTVPFTVQVLPVGPVLWVPFALMAIGILLPLAILYGINRWAARLRLEGLMMARVPVEITLAESGRIARTDKPDGALVGFADLNFPGSPDSARGWSPGAGTLRARTPVNPFGSVDARVDAPPGYVVVSNISPTTTSEGRAAGIDLCPNMSAYILLPVESLDSASPGDAIQGELYAFLIPDNAERDASALSQHLQTTGGWGDSLLRLKSGLSAGRVMEPAAATTTDTSSANADWSPPTTDRFGLGSSDTPAPSQPKNTAALPPPDDTPPPSGGNRFSL
jgi:hypothetical protein